MRETVCLSAAAKLVGVGIGQVRTWERQGRVQKLPDSRNFAVDDLRAVAGWAARACSEAEAARTIGVLTVTLRELAETGELGEWREHAGRREYVREHVEAYASRRAHLMSMREACREFALPWWVMARLVEDGLVATIPGAKGSKLVDPVELKPLLLCQPCEECGLPLPPGRRYHTACFNRTPGARLATSQRIAGWWASPAADDFRARLYELPCANPECRKPMRIKAAQFKLRSAQSRSGNLFCSKACWAAHRWQKTGAGLEAFARRQQPRVRQKALGRWNGHRGAEAGWEKGGRPRNWGSPEQQREQQQRIYELHKQGLSSRAISEKVFGDKRYQKRVLRLLDS